MRQRFGTDLKTVITGALMAFGITFGSACTRAEHVDFKAFPDATETLPRKANAEPQTLVLAGGCFWCTEGVFEEIPGVIDVVSGYAGGTAETANYEAVCSGRTKHAEAIQITYDSAQVTYTQLLKVFFNVAHDPTTLNRQGNDVGPQYRSAIFFANDAEQRVAQAYIAQLDEAKVFASKIVTTLEPLTEFYPAEAYHQDYTRQNPNQGYIAAISMPKKLKAQKVAEELKNAEPTSQPAK